MDTFHQLPKTFQESLQKVSAFSTSILWPYPVQVTPGNEAFEGVDCKLTEERPFPTAQAQPEMV